MSLQEELLALCDKYSLPKLKAFLVAASDDDACKAVLDAAPSGKLDRYMADAMQALPAKVLFKCVSPQLKDKSTLARALAAEAGFSDFVDPDKREEAILKYIVENIKDAKEDAQALLQKRSSASEIDQLKAQLEEQKKTNGELMAKMQELATLIASKRRRPSKKPEGTEGAEKKPRKEAAKPRKHVVADPEEHTQVYKT